MADFVSSGWSTFITVVTLVSVAFCFWLAYSMASAKVVTDDKGNAFYIVRVRTLKSSLGENLPIIPGMVAEVDILTGKKTVLSYLIKPVIRAKANALTER